MSGFPDVQILEGRGLMPLYGDEMACSFGCTYCFATTPEVSRNRRQQETRVVDVDKRVQEMIGMYGQMLTCIFGTRLHDIFGKGPMQAMPRISQLACHGLHVSLLTKAALSEEEIDALEAIDRNLRARTGKRVVVEFSLVSGEQRYDLEPHAPEVCARIDSMKALSRRGMCTAVCISPLLPSSLVSDAELFSLVDHTSDTVPAYTVGKGLFYPPHLARKLGLHDQEAKGHSFNSNFLPFGIGGEVNQWGIYKSPRTDMLKAYILEQDRKAFSLSSDTVQYVAERQSTL